MNTLRLSLLVAGLALVLPARLDAAPLGGGKDIVDTAVSAGTFNTLAAALTEAELVDALKGEGPFTVFAPSDEAFAKLPKGTVETLLKPENRERLVAILTYHVVSGTVTADKVVKLTSADTLNGQRVAIKVADGKVMVDESLVVSTDIRASNGVIHVIDSVLLPSDKNIVETAAAAGDFGTLIAAAKAAGLVEALTGEGPITVLAPTDDAFAALPEGTVASLLRPENKDKLTAILTYHVIPGRVYSDQALAAGRADTLQGSAVEFAVRGGKAYVNKAGIVATDIDATNGVIHVIDGVILPPEDTADAMPVREVIEVAIAEGAPLFNNGQAAACAAVYTVATECLLRMPAVAGSDKAAPRLQTALAHARRSHDMSERAWTLRNALDEVYIMVERPERPTPMARMDMDMSVNTSSQAAGASNSCSSDW